MKHPIHITITDLHFEENSLQSTFDVVKEAINAAHMVKCPVYVGGDVFDSRRAQSQVVLDVWTEVLEYADLRQVELRCIPGNHDKMSYKSERSYLDLYKYHPSMTLVRDYAYFDHDNIRIHMIPFFDEKTVYTEYLSRVEYGQGINHLITHIAVDAVRNNDGSMVTDTLSLDLFNKFDKVYIGHYHNKQTIRNIHYIGSIKQKDFGEDDDKGYMIGYSDGDHEYIQGDFKRYTVVKIDIDSTTPQQLEQYAQQYAGSQDNVRFKLTGSKQSAATIDQNKLFQLGIDVKYEYKEDIKLIDGKDHQFSGFDKDSILSEWDKFCEVNKDVDKDNGKLRLQQAI